jgi:hypothetical protein
MSILASEEDLFLCGPAPVKCAFCAEPAGYRCNWKVERAINTMILDLKVGDVAVYTREGPKKGRTLRIRRIKKDRDFRTVFADEFLPNGRQASRPFEYQFHEEHELAVLRMVSCWEPACERHVRELDDQFHSCWNCKDRWKECAV